MDNFGVDSTELFDFFATISVGKQERKKELDETVGDSVDDFFSTISTGKKIIKEQKESFAGDSFDRLFLSKLTEDKKSKQKKKKKEIKRQELKEKTIIEKSLGLLAEPTEVKQQNDPLTPLNQNFATLDDLQKHYKLFLGRIQQQLSSLGGGGETNLTYMDVPTASVISSSYSVKHQDYYIGVNYAGAVTITLPKSDREGKIFVVKDELGEASRGNNRYITIIPSGSDLIDGQDRVILAYDYGSLTFIWKGNSWRII